MGIYLSIIKAICDTITARMILNGEKPKAFPASPGTQQETRMLIPSALIQYSTGSSSHSRQASKKIKGIQIGEEELKLSLFADDMVYL